MAVRRVRRIIRKVDPWTVLKASLVFNAIMGLIFVLGTWVMWSLVLQKGIPEKIVDLFDAVTIELTIDGELYFRIVVLLAVIGVIQVLAKAVPWGPAGLSWDGKLPAGIARVAPLPKYTHMSPQNASGKGLNDKPVSRLVIVVLIIATSIIAAALFLVFRRRRTGKH